MAKKKTKATEKKAIEKSSKPEEDPTNEEEKLSTIELKLRAKGLGREDRRTVKDLLQYGADEEGGEKQTFLQSLVLPGVMFLVFCASLVVWHFLFLKGEKLFSESNKKNWGKMMKDL